MGKICPFLCIFHHFPTTCCIIIIHGYFLPDILFGDAEAFFHAKLNGQSMGVPSCLAFHVKTPHCLISADNILNRAGHHMMNARHTVGGWGAFEKDECGASLTLFHRSLKKRMLIPRAEHLFIDVRKIKLLAVFFEFFAHCRNYVIGKYYLNFAPLQPLVPPLTPPPIAKILAS